MVRLGSVQITVSVSDLTDRALLTNILERLIIQGEKLSSITDAVAATQAAVDQLKSDIAEEIQQVVNALANTADVPAALDGLNNITAQLTAQSDALRADNPPAPPTF